jgi:hypothetical protein
LIVHPDIENPHHRRHSHHHHHRHHRRPPIPITSAAHTRALVCSSVFTSTSATIVDGWFINNPHDVGFAQRPGQLSSVWRNPLPLPTRPSLISISNDRSSTRQHLDTGFDQICRAQSAIIMSMSQQDVTPEAMQQRIQQARREAESLKDRIKRKKDDLADGTRK